VKMHPIQPAAAGEGAVAGAGARTVAVAVAVGGRGRQGRRRALDDGAGRDSCTGNNSVILSLLRFLMVIATSYYQTSKNRQRPPKFVHGNVV